VSENAAVLVAAIVQRGPAIKNVGGYVRSLTAKASAGAFSLEAVLMALIRTNLRDRERRQR
jgi:replication initiation protein RepC